MNCTQCGAGLRDTAKICINCGALVKIHSMPDVEEEVTLLSDPAPRALEIDEIKPTVSSDHIVISSSEPVSPQPGSGSRPLFEPAPDLPPLESSGSTTFAVASKSNGKKAYIYVSLAGAAIIALASLVLLLSDKMKLSIATQSQSTTKSATASPENLPSSNAISPSPPHNVAVTNIDSTPTSSEQVENSNTTHEATLVSKATLNELLELAGNNSWSTVGEKVRGSKFATYLRGDRKLARELNKNALDMMGSNDFTGAIAKLEQAVGTDKGDIEIRNNLGYAYLRIGKPLNAMPHLLEALMMDPTRANAWMNAGEAFAEQGKIPASEAALYLAVHFSRNQAKALEMLKGDETIIPSNKFRSIIQNVQPKLSVIPSFTR